MPTLSCAMIVRDAEATLARALLSVADCVNEIVVVDTGSADRTVEIAHAFTRHVFQFPWCDDFSAARQFAHDKCRGDWVFYIDADDEVIGASALRRRVETAPDEIDAYMILYALDVDTDGNAKTEFYRERLIRRERMRWAGRVHEVMVPTNGACNYERFDATWVVHRGHGGGLASLERNIRLLRLQLADMPDDTRTMFYLGRDLVQLGQINEGRKLLQRYMKTATWRDEMYFAQTLIAYCYRHDKLYREAMDADMQLLYIKPLWPGAYFQLAQDCYFLGQWAESAHFSEIGQRLPAPETNLFVSRESLTYEWMIYQVVALSQLGRVPEAAELTERALAIKPDDPMHLANRAYFQGLMSPKLQEA